MWYVMIAFWVTFIILLIHAAKTSAKKAPLKINVEEKMFMDCFEEPFVLT